jgi:hypothetical protein
VRSKKEIESVYEIDPIKVSEPVHWKLKNVAPNEHDLIWYGMKKHGFFHHFFNKVLKTLAGQNKAGKIINEGEGIAAHFIPGGKYLKAGLDAIGNALKNVTKSPVKRTLTATNTTGKLLYGLAGMVGAYFSGIHTNTNPIPNTMFHYLLTLILMIASASITYGIKHLKDKPFIQLILQDIEDIEGKAEAALSADSDEGTKISKQEKQLILQTIKTKAEGISKQLVHKFFSGVLGHSSH